LAASHATALWHLYATLGVMLGFVGAAVSGVLSASLLGRWFPTRRLGVALAVAWSASGVGTMLMIPLAQHMITTSGWRWRAAASAEDPSGTPVTSYPAVERYSTYPDRAWQSSSTIKMAGPGA